MRIPISVSHSPLSIKKTLPRHLNFCTCLILISPILSLHLGLLFFCFYNWYLVLCVKITISLQRFKKLEERTDELTEKTKIKLEKNNKKKKQKWQWACGTVHRKISSGTKWRKKEERGSKYPKFLFHSRKRSQSERLARTESIPEH